MPFSGSIAACVSCTRSSEAFHLRMTDRDEDRWLTGVLQFRALKASPYPPLQLIKIKQAFLRFTLRVSKRLTSRIDYL